MISLLADSGSPVPLVFVVLGFASGLITCFVTDGGSLKACRAILKREVLSAGMRYLPEHMVPRNQFVAGGTNPAGTIAPLQDFPDQLVIVLHITETLDHNTRIWTKE